MKKELTLTLMDGLFDNEDTTDIILSMIDKKIEFDELNSFRNLIKYNKKDEGLEKRIYELRKARLTFLEFMHNNRKEKFKLASEITIKIN